MALNHRILSWLISHYFYYILLHSIAIVPVCSLVNDSDSQPILQTTHGLIKGQKRTSIYDDVYYSFERIPFAQPPIGELRFKAPVPATPWAGVLDCTNSGNKPVQKNSQTGEIEGSEDCLFLNVYCKKLHSNKPLPVLVYIYGGAFQNGEATREQLGPDYFMHEDVILVTLNYRVGPLGFLWLNDPVLKVPGNAAFKDQLLAMRWFKHNCLNFNGDPNNITLFGESAGGASVHYMMIAKAAEGLFHKAIVMSGTVYNKWAQQPEGDYAYKLAQVNGFKGDNNDKQVLKFLNQIEARKLFEHNLMTDEQRLRLKPFIFGPTIETYVGEDCIIPVSPTEMLHNAWSNKMPLMIGGTSFEGLKFYAPTKANPSEMQVYKNHSEFLVPPEVRKRKGLEKSKELGEQVLKMYMGNTKLSFDNVFKYLEIFSYRVYWLGFHRTILSRLAYAKAPTYVYRFDFDSPNFNFYRLRFCGSDCRGVAHADDLSYLFFSKRAWKLERNSAEYLTIRRMVSMWTSFARNSNPNCKEIKPANWTPAKRDDPNECLNISNNVTVMQLPEAEKLAFWEHMYAANELI